MNETTREHLVKTLSSSIFEQLKDSPYFPCLALNYFDPDVSDDLIYKAWEKLKPQWGERSKEDIKRLVYAYWRREAIRKWRKIDRGETDILVKSLHVDPCDYKAIDEIGGYESISLFELAVFIGEKVLQNPRILIFDCTDFFAEYILNGRLNPRDPENKIAYTDSPQKSRSINGKIDFYKPSPDLSWELTNPEAANFAELIWEASYLFDKQQPKNQATIDKAMMNETTTDKATGEWKTKNEREFLYRTIGTLALLLIEKADRNKFGSRANPNKSAIYNAIGQILADMGFKDDGQTRSSLNNVLKDALDVAMTPKGD